MAFRSHLENQTAQTNSRTVVLPSPLNYDLSAFSSSSVQNLLSVAGLLLPSDKYLGVCLELTCYLLDYRNRIINVECFHSFVVKEAYLVHQGNNLSKSVYVRFSRGFLMTLKASPKSSVRIKSLFLFAPDLR